MAKYNENDGTKEEENDGTKEELAAREAAKEVAIRNAALDASKWIPGRRPGQYTETEIVTADAWLACLKTLNPPGKAQEIARRVRALSVHQSYVEGVASKFLGLEP